MKDYSHIRKIIENNFWPTERKLLLETTSADIMQSLENAQSIMKQFHKNIVTQTSLSDMHKNILSFFFNMTAEQNLRLIVAVKQGMYLDMDHLYRVYIDVLHERAVTANVQFLQKIYFPQRIKWLMQDSKFQKQMQSITDSSYEEWPLAKNKFKYMYKSKKFYEDCITVYIEKHVKIMNEVIHIHRNDVLDNAMLIDPSEDTIVNFFAHETLHFSDLIVHNDISHKLFVETIQETIRKSHEEAKKREKTTKQKDTRTVYKQEDASPDTSVTEELSKQFAPNTYQREKFDAVFASFQQAYNSKSNQNSAKIEQYVWRMYKNKWSVHMKYIQDTLWPQFDDEIINLVRDLCTKLNMNIKELDDALEEDLISTADDSLWGNKDQYDNSREDVLVAHVKSPTLEKFKTQPTLLQAADIILIFEEYGYTIANSKKFSKQLDTLITNNWKIFDARRSKLIYYLNLPIEAQKILENIWSKIGLYHVLKFPGQSNPPRIIRKGGLIMWCVDHDLYDKLIKPMKKGLNIDNHF